jgi:hypothetical protein
MVDLVSMDTQCRNFVVWNVRGLNNPNLCTVVRLAVLEAAASVVCVSESKLETISPYVVAESFGARFDGFTFLPAVGTAGGIIVAWCSDDVRVVASRVDNFSMSIQMSMDGCDPWWLTTMYG